MYRPLSLSELDQKLNLLVNRGVLPAISYSLTEKDHIVHKNTIGFCSLNAKVPLKVKSNSFFRAIGASDLVICLAILKAIDAKKISLDQDVNRVLDFGLVNPFFKSNKITIKQLLTHTSSIRDHQVTFSSNAFALQDFFQLNKKNQGADCCYENGKHFDATHMPGTYFEYSQLNLGILATVLERIYKQRFDKVIEHLIFKELDISAVYNTKILSVEDKKNHVISYTKEQKGIISYKFDWQIQYDHCLDNNDRSDIFNDLPMTDEDSYEIGKNATIWARKDSLHISIDDLTKIATLLSQRGIINKQSLISSQCMDKFRHPHWRYNSNKQNGNTNNQLITQFGLSNIHFNFQKDSPFLLEKEYWKGYQGRSKGLLSGIYFNLDTHQSISFMTSGLGVCPEYINESGFYQIEFYIVSALFNALKTYHDRDD